MRRRWVVVVALGLLASPGLVGSSEAAPSDLVPGSDPQAVALLGSAVRAETGVTYRGTEVVAADDDLPGVPAAHSAQVLDVSHRVGDGTLLVVHPTGSSPSRVGLTDESARLPDLLVPLLQRTYRLVVAGPSTVADRTTEVVEALRTDGTVAARFWVDRATGLLLRRDLLDRAGAVVSSSAFSRVQLVAQDPSYLPPLLPRATTASLDDASLAGWRSRGWPCPQRLGDMTLYDARTLDGSGVLHLSYSDGLSTTSVFVQPGRLDVDGLGPTQSAVVAGQPVRLVDGSPRQLFWSADGYVISVVSDAPADDLAQVVAGLPRPDAPPAGWSRVERGLSRVVSWVNPFD